MKWIDLSSLAILAAIAVSPASAQNADPAVQPGAAPQTQPAAARGGRRGGGGAPAAAFITPKPEEIAAIRSKLDQLNTAIKSLKDAKSDDALIAEAEVSAHYVQLTLRFPEEFFEQGVIGRCMSALEAGLSRAEEIKAGKPSWVNATGRINRAFRSRVDGTPQPYRVIIPAGYDKSKPAPLYVYLHGRGDTDLGLGWIGGQSRAANGEVAIAGDNRRPERIQLQVFGRANNSFRYPGEVDVFEALEAVRKNYNVDPDRIVMAGFSMGGAGSWQLGLNIPDLFCGLEIDAGVIGNRRSMEGLTPSQKAANAIYGIVIDHAVNVSTVPLVGYAGENDAQLAASTNIREQLGREGYTIEHPSQFVWKGTDIRALFLATPNQGHTHATGETLRLINEFTAENIERGRVVPDHIRFVTYTTRYNKDYWITIDGMQQHFDRAYVDATRDSQKTNYTIKTTNVSRLKLDDMSAAKKLTIDSDTLTVTPTAGLMIEQSAGHWKLADQSSGTALRKQHNLQGPINDAFLDAFLCVTPSGQSYSPLVDQRSKEELARFDRLIAKEYRGAVRSKADGSITPDDIATNNLVLLGDPGSNKIIAQIADKLPIKWSKEGIVVGDKTYSIAEHVPVLIYPNPLNPKRYVVINTGLVATGPNSNNSYGDYAVLKMSKQDAGIATEIADGGVFDESWKLPARK